MRPTKYRGTDVNLTPFVTRDREPTGADYRQPETGRLYPLGCVWQVGKDPSTGVEGELWMLSKIVANVAFWVMVSGGSAGPLLNIEVDNFTPPGTDPVLPDGFGTVTISGGQVASATIGANVIETHSRAANEFNIEIQQSGSAIAKNTTLNGVAHFDSNDFSVDEGFVSITGGTFLGALTPDVGGQVVADINDNIDVFGQNPASQNGIETFNNGVSEMGVRMKSPFTLEDFEFRSAVSGQTRTVSATNTSNTASSQSTFLSSVAGGTAGDTWYQWTVGTSRSYALGIDNSSSSDSWMFTTAASATVNPSTTLPMMEYRPSIGFIFSDEGTNSFGIGIGEAPSSPVPLSVIKNQDSVTAVRITNSDAGSSAFPAFSLLGTSAGNNASFGQFGANYGTTVFRNKAGLQQNNSGLFVSIEQTGEFNVFCKLDGTNPAEVIRVNQSNTRIAAGKPFRMNTSAGAVGSSASNDLGIYEEGTWTPTLIGATTAGSTTYVAQNGYYVRVGNVVTAYANVQISAATGTGTATFSLPFTIKNQTNGNVEGSIRMDGSGWAWPAGRTSMSFAGTPNTTTGRPAMSGSSVTLSALQMTNAASTFVYTLTYQI